MCVIYDTNFVGLIISSIKLLQKVYAILRQSSYSDIFSETAWPVQAKLYVEHRYEKGMKVCING